MATLYTEQPRNIRRTWVLMSLFFLIIISLGWVFSYVYHSAAILYIAVILSLGMNIASYWYSDKIVLAISGAVPLQKNDQPLLWNVVENLSITAGLPMPRLYLIPDPAPNAFATGRDKEHAVVAVTAGLLPLLNKSELEGVIAHELSHVGNRDTLISTAVVVLVGLITLLSDFFIRSFAWRGRSDREGGGQLQALLIVVGIILAILSPIIATLVQLAISRRREFLADASGALLTRYPDGLISALKKISAYQKPMLRASNATAHLYIANPFGAKSQTSFLAKLFMTHPPMEERIAALRQGYGGK